MIDFANKVFMIILTFVMLVLAPFTWSYVRADMVAERLVLNEVSLFIDKVTDKGVITQRDIDDLYLGVNAHGLTYDVEVKRYMSTPYPGDNINESVPVYFSVDFLDELMTQGDIIKVTVTEIGISPAKRLLWTLLRIDEGRSSFSLAGSVR